MQARGLLMIEHRLIERMLKEIRKMLQRIEAGDTIDPIWVDLAVDFIRTYADRTHHGKEEDILFRELENRSLSETDQRLMQELVEEHELGRRTTKALVEANTRYRNGDQTALPEIAKNLKTLTEFYPKHIEKEDKVFFPAALTYISRDEDQAMLTAFREFDQNMIHEKYRTLVENLAREE